jgi:NAD(P)-dependent dehydrogenase (short-subunit alcohol dehydrogenase family)
VIRATLRSTFTVSRHASAYWRANRGRPARLINVTSPSALFGTSPSPYYSAARLAIVGFTLSCANALSRYGVTSNVLAPLVADGATEPGDVGPAAVYMASGDVDWLNGKVIGAGDHRIVLFESPVIEYEALVIDGWGREVVFGELEQVRDLRVAPPVLYLLDEILQGTNTAERQIAARRVIRLLLRCLTAR